MRKPTQPPTPLMLGFASFQDGTYELIIRDPETGYETTLHGTMRAGQLEEVDALLPACCFVRVAPQALEQ